jgi:hypothetical protein
MAGQQRGDSGALSSAAIPASRHSQRAASRIARSSTNTIRSTVYPMIVRFRPRSGAARASPQRARLASSTSPPELVLHILQLLE